VQQIIGPLHEELIEIRMGANLLAVHHARLILEALGQAKIGCLMRIAGKIFDPGFPYLRVL
jgi:hypothetical protein